MCNKLIVIILGGLFLPCTKIHCQKFISGVTIDAKSKEPIQYANIFFKNRQQVGTLSEIDGSFNLRISNDVINDTLVFSILGYGDKYIPVSELNENYLEVQLDIQAIELDEIAILDQSYLKDLLLKAVKHIPQNYPIEKHRLTGYFQETSNTQGEYSHFLEAYLTIENHGYHKNTKLVRHEKTNSKYPSAENKIRYHQVRRSDDKRYLPDRFETWLGGSIHELMRNNFVYEKAIDSYRNHTFEDLLYDIENIDIIKTREKPGDYRELKDEDWTIVELTESRIIGLGEQCRNQDTLITIGIKSDLSIKNKDDSDPIYFAITKLLINKSNYAIEKIVKTSSEEMKSKYPDAFTDNYYKEIQYRNINGRYYPTLIINKIGLNYNLETRKEINTTRFLVQEIQPSKEHFLNIKPGKKLKRDERLVDKKYKYDPEFWKTYDVPKEMEASLTLKSELSRQNSLEEQFIRNEKPNNR